MQFQIVCYFHTDSDHKATLFPPIINYPKVFSHCKGSKPWFTLMWPKITSLSQIKCKSIGPDGGAVICVFCIFVLFIFDYFSSQCFPLVTTYPDSPHQCLCAFKPWPALRSPPDCLSFFLNKLSLIYLLPRGFQWMLDLFLPRPCRTTY